MNNERKGFIELIIATFFFSLFGVFTRLISNQLGVFFQLILRAILMSIMFYFVAKFTKTLKAIDKKDLRLFLLRGLFIVADFSCFYLAINNLPLGLSLFIFYAANVIISFVFGSLFLKEKLTLIKLTSLILAVLGLFIMYNGSFTSFRLIPLIAAAISGFCFGLTTTTSKKLTDKYSSTQVNLVAYLSASLLVLPLLFLSKEVINLNFPLITFIEVVGFALVGVGAFLLTLDGYKYLEAQKASIVMLMELIFVIIIGLLFYHEIPTISSIIGGIFIFSALALPNINFKSS